MGWKSRSRVHRERRRTPRARVCRAQDTPAHPGFRGRGRILEKPRPGRYWPPTEPRPPARPIPPRADNGGGSSPPSASSRRYAFAHYIREAYVCTYVHIYVCIYVIHRRLYRVRSALLQRIDHLLFPGRGNFPGRVVTSSRPARSICPIDVGNRLLDRTIGVRFLISTDRRSTELHAPRATARAFDRVSLFGPMRSKGKCVPGFFAGLVRRSSTIVLWSRF